MYMEILHRLLRQMGEQIEGEPLLRNFQRQSLAGADATIAALTVTHS